MSWLIASDIHSDNAMWRSIFKQVRNTSGITAVILCGDLTQLGVHRAYEVSHARQWMKALGKLVPVYYILGNHDLGLENFDFESIANVKCLEGVVTEIDGLTVYGVVDTPCFDMPVLATRWHKMNPSYDYDEALWREVPKVDVIVSHGPPFQCLDWCGRAVGSPGLRDYIQRVQPKLVLTGHIHEQGGGRDSIRETIVINCARDTVVERVNNA